MNPSPSLRHAQLELVIQALDHLRVASRNLAHARIQHPNSTSDGSAERIIAENYERLQTCVRSLEQVAFPTASASASAEA